ncbi:MAG: hypothetical protein ABIQ15_11120 [Nocardioides sp.]
MSAGANPLIGRPHWTLRARNVAIGLPLLAIAVGVLLRGNPLGLLILPLSLYTLADLWRKVTVTDDRLVAQGRVARRSAELSHLVDAGVGPMARAWVAWRDDRAFYLPMLSDMKNEPGNPDAWTFVDLLRARAEAAGATVAPPSQEDTSPAPQDAAPFFGS